MIQLFKRFTRSEFFIASFYSALATFVKMGTGFVLAKILSVMVGPSGLALLGQMNNFVTIILTLSTGAINNGVIKYIAEFRQDEEKCNDIITTSGNIITICTIIVSLALLLFAKFWSVKILRDPAYISIFYVFAITLIFYSINSLFISILNGYKSFKKLNYINITSSLAGLTFSLILVYFWGVYGVLISTVTFQSVVFLIGLIIVKNTDWFKRKLFRVKIDKKVVALMTQFAMMALVTALVSPVSQIVIRNFITNSYGLDAAGFYEAINRISSMYLTIITISLTSYYLPKLSETQGDMAIRHEIFKVAKIVLPALMFMCVVIFLTRGIIIKILFAESFSVMKSFFPAQLLGDFLKVTSWLIAFQIIAKAKYKLYIITEVVFSASLVFLSFFYIKRFGVVGATYAYATNYFLHLTTMVCIFNKTLFARANK